MNPITLVIAFLLAAGSAIGAVQRPNLVFILFDDLGYGEPPCYRPDSPFKMPTLDRLAREGMRFTDAHSASAVCTPTRYGVLTGRYPMRIGQFGVLTTFSPPIIERDRLTVASLLKQRGYHTAAVGKWHLGMTWDVSPELKKTEQAMPIGTAAADGPSALGFDYFCGYTHARNIGMVMEQDKVATNVAPGEVQPLLAKKAVAYIDERASAGGPFFLYVPLCTPHLPLVPAPEFNGQSGAEKYGDWIFQGDWVAGQILDALERHKLSDHTLVIVTSDNGAERREYPPLRESKRSIYEGGHRVPFLARWPGQIKPGSLCTDVICLNDLMATAAEIVGAKLPANAAEDSVSILPALLGTGKAPVREATIHQSMAGDLAIRQGPWKLIFKTNGARELYDLAGDLSEKTNVLANQADIAERLGKLMHSYVTNGRSTPGQPQQNTYDVQLDGSGKRKTAAPQKSLPLPGEIFPVQGRAAFVILPKPKSTNALIPWVWYAPTLPGLPGNEEKWMFERFTQAGIAIAGIDVGESFGSLDGRRLYSALYDELTRHRGFAPKTVMLGRSRGGLMALSWAAENANKVAGFAGIYPVCNLASYPGVAKASGAFHMTEEELSARLAEHNPIDRLAALAKAAVPLFAIHGDSDQTVPLEANSGELRKRYEALGGKMQLIIPPGQGHNMWNGFFQCQELVDFVRSFTFPIGRP